MSDTIDQTLGQVLVERRGGLTPDLSSDGMSSGDAPRPRRRSPERRHVFVGQVLHPPKEHLHDCVTVAGGEEDVHAILQVCRQREHLGVGDRPSLVEDELVDVRGDRRCAEGQEPAVGAAHTR